MSYVLTFCAGALATIICELIALLWLCLKTEQKVHGGTNPEEF